MTRYLSQNITVNRSAALVIRGMTGQGRGKIPQNAGGFWDESICVAGWVVLISNVTIV